MITLNNKALNARIRTQVGIAIDLIKHNANQGRAKTSVTFDGDIFRECRAKLNEYMKDNSVDFCWQGIGGYNSVQEGDKRRMNFVLKS